jgi:MFS family permease
MDRRSALVLLVVFGIGVFLAGLELIVTAVALPSILVDLVEPTGGSAWIELRKASWIVNGYLLAYVVTMPLSGRLADLWGARRLFMGALVLFVVGSALAGASQNLDQLIAARVIQGVGGGVLVPVATAAASHLFEGHDRPRALGVIGALTFLGMAAGPFVGAAILGGVHVEGAVERLGLDGGPLAAALAPSWRWIFYINVPIGLIALTLAWAASSGWDTPRRAGRVDVIGAALFTVALASGLIGLTLLGSSQVAGLDVDPTVISAVLFVVAAIATALTFIRDVGQETPFLEVRLFRSVSFSSAAIVSLLTGYAFATAIIGGAVFVDRVLYGGPDDQRLALGALAGATAIGALVSGFAVRLLSLRLVTLIGLVAGAAALIVMSTWTAAVSIEQVGLALGVFGFGFGLTVTPRSTAAVESAGRDAFGIASAVVTVARMIGMAIGLAILTAYGSTTIDRLYDRIYATPEGYTTVIPEELRDRPLRDPFVVEALEEWASREAAGIMVGLFVVAAGVMLVAIPPGLALGGRRRRVTEAVAQVPTREGIERGEPTAVL